MPSILDQDPVKLLRISPLILSTATLTFALCEAHFYSLFLHESLRSKSNTILPTWWKINFGRFMPVFAATYALNIALGTGNLMTRTSELNDSGSWYYYLLGTVGTAAHFLWGTTDLQHIQDITEERTKGRSVEAMKDWLSMHRIRMLVADVPAWIGNFLGVLATIKL